MDRPESNSSRKEDQIMTAETTAGTTLRATLYEIIDQLRREHTSPAASKTLDMVVRELGRTQDNLREALDRLQRTPLPLGSDEVLSELKLRAWLAGVDDLRVPLPPEEMEAYLEPVDEGEVGIAIMLAVSGLLIFALSLLVTIRHPVG
jgi:hypothetical protein